MTAVAVPTVGGRAQPATGSAFADARVARRAFHQIWIGATIGAVVFGGTAASSALSYVTTFPDAASRAQVAAVTRGDAGLAMLVGPVDAIDTVGGYTFYKTFAFLSTIGAVWAVFAATRLLRGEEDAGRWQLVLAGRTRAGRATAATMIALGAGVGIIFAGTAALTALAGRGPDVGLSVGESALYAISIAIVPAVFVAVGAVTSQLGRTRRMATGLGIGTVAAAFVVRMVADSGPGAHWLLWATPFGWSELIAPFSGNDLRPIVPAVLAIVVLGAAAVVLAGRRDIGDGVFASRDAAPLRPFGLGGPFGLAARLEVPVLAAWAAGAVACSFAMGILATIATRSMPESFEGTLERFGVQGRFLDQYFGVVFLLVAMVVALLPASQIGATYDEESSGRAVHVLVSPTRRTAWFAGRLALAAGAVVVVGVLTGIGAWVGATLQGVDADAASLVGAGMNIVPTALLVLGIGSMLLAVVPRFAAPLTYILVFWSLIIDLVSSMVSGASWMGNLSVFHTMALAPAESASATTIALTTIVAIALGGLATLVFGRRDLELG